MRAATCATLRETRTTGSNPDRPDCPRRAIAWKHLTATYSKQLLHNACTCHTRLLHARSIYHLRGVAAAAYIMKIARIQHVESLPTERYHLLHNARAGSRATCSYILRFAPCGANM